MPSRRKVSSWLLIGALIWGEIFAPLAWADSHPFSKEQTLRASQQESRSGLEEIAQALGGLEESEILRVLFNKMLAPPRPGSDNEEIYAWFRRLQQSPQPGMASPLQFTAQRINGLVEAGGFYSYAQRENLWGDVEQGMASHLNDFFKVAWAKEVFGRLREMVPDPPGKDSIRRILWRLANAEVALIQSFSGIRAVVGEPVPLPVAKPLPDAELSREHQLIFGRYGYLYAQHQIRKFRSAQPNKRKFLFVLGRDPRPSGKAIMDAQIRGMLKAAQEMEVEVRFLDAGILPTPFVEALVRATSADGGAIITASHNPLEWNGVKYLTAAEEPEDALVSGGILLPAREMKGIVDRFRAWAKDTGQNVREANRFLKELNRFDSRQSIRELPSDEVHRQVIQEARQMWGLENDGDFESFRRRANRIKIVVDPNGGAAAQQYAWFLREMGLWVIEINHQPGRPQHILEPVEDAMRDAKRWLKREKAHFAIITDYDADRANTLIRNPATGRIIEPNPQEVSAMNVAMALARASIQKTPDIRPMAVVVHDATSRRIWEIAKVFGAQVHLVETGEVNVLEKMRQLERDGDRVIIGIEGANGGTVFRGDHREFKGDTSRNGAMTGLFIGMVAMDSAIGRTWLEKRNQKAPPRVRKVSITSEPTLAELLKSLPGERSNGEWKFVTPIWKQGSVGEVPEKLIEIFQKKIEEVWEEQIKPGLMVGGPGLELAGWKFPQHFTGSDIIYTKESQAVAWKHSPDADRGPYGGGWTLQLRTPHGRGAFVWLRGSLTEGLTRVSVEGQGANAAQVARALKKLIEEEWYPEALRRTQVAAGLEESKIQVLHQHEGPVVDVVFGREPSSNIFASASSNGEIRFWDRESGGGRFIPIFLDPISPLVAIDISSTGQGILAVTESYAKRWSIPHSYIYAGPTLFFKERLPSSKKRYPGSVAISPDRESLLVGGEIPEAIIQNLEPEDKEFVKDREGLVKKRLLPQEGQPLSVAFGPYGKTAVLGTSTGGVEFWDVSDPSSAMGERIKILSGHPGQVLAVASQGNTVASADDQGVIRIWNVKTGDFHQVHHPRNEKLSVLAFRPERDKTGKIDPRIEPEILASAGKSGTVRLWEVETGATRGVLSGRIPIQSLSISPDGKKVAAGRKDGTVALWDMPSFAGLEEGTSTITIPSAEEAKKLLILGPEALPILEVLARLKPVDDQPIPLGLIVWQDQKEVVQSRLSELGIHPEFFIPLEKTTTSSLERLVEDIQAEYEDWFVETLYNLREETLLNMARFLGIPDPEDFSRQTLEALDQQKRLEPEA